MTREQEILSHAFNFVDEELISAAHAPRRRWRRNVPWLVAACLTIVIVAAFPALRDVINISEMDEAAGEADVPDEHLPNAGITVEGADKPTLSSIHPIGKSVTLGGTTLTMTSVTDTTATFTVLKTDAEPLYAAIYQYRGGVLGTTEPNYRDNGVIIRPYTIKLTVNGAPEEVYEFPTAPGSYEIVVNFASLRKGSYRLEDYICLYAYIGEDRDAVRECFSLTVPQESADSTASSETPAEGDSAHDGTVTEEVSSAS